MKRILSTLGQAFRKSILAVCLMSLISLTGVMILPGQPAYAAIVDISSNQTKTGATIEGFSKDNKAVVNRDEAYEEAVKATEKPKVGIEKVYEQDLHAYQEENPPESILEKAEEAIDKITAQPR
ncbi:hypothetical protein PN499_19320 [Kamptonema animale CS-326]|uniref:hypothetical protein n=1 Tax=Kamptonema animale TaxID=92934 RepID=UPI00232ACD8A|nr:hypothetical protein [Kamptonema animale]MDB9513348.1 hypothetical protein [Kamptonema animale CS-326]